MADDDKRPDGLDSPNDPGEERVPIYSYPAKYRWLFNGFLIFGSLGVWVYQVVTELLVETGDTWKTTSDAIINAIPVSGLTGVVAGIIAVEVKLVVSELLKMRQEKMRAKYEESEARRKQAEAEADDLRKRLEKSESGRKQAEARAEAAESGQRL